ncbi:unnamed protein product [Pylaiella littoralis]
MANIGIADFVGDVVDIGKKIPEAIENLEEMIINLLNGMKGKLFDVVNGAVSGTVNGVNKSVNTLPDGLENGIRGIVSGINNAMDVAERGVGGIVTGVNNSMNSVESVVNGVSNGMEGSVYRIVGSVNSVVSKISSIKNKEIKVSLWGVKPFSFLGDTPTVRTLNIPTLNIKDMHAKAQLPKRQGTKHPGDQAEAPHDPRTGGPGSGRFQHASYPGLRIFFGKDCLPEVIGREHLRDGNGAPIRRGCNTVVNRHHRGRVDVNIHQREPDFGEYRGEAW